MDIEKHAQMMRWLTRPKSTVPGPRNMYAGGQLVAPSVDGSRPGYQGDPYKRTTVYKKRQEAKKKGLTYDVKTKKFKPLKATAQDTEQSIKMINDWTKEWINKNSKNYGVREFDKFKKDLAGDWKKQLKVFEKNPKFRFSKTGPGSTLISTADGLPYVRGLDIDKVTTPIKKDPTLGYEKIFYNKKLQNPEFKKKVTEYLDFVNLDKRYGSVRDEMAAAGKIATDPEGKGFFKKSSGSKKAYLEYAKFADDDVVYFFGDVLNSRKLWNNNPASLNIYSILEQNIDPKKVKAYRKKLSTSYSSWMNNLKEVSDLAGYDFDKVLAAQYKEAEKMKKLFNVESLPFEFQYAQDHLFGLAEAKTLGDPKIAQQTLNNIVAATKDQNRFLGTKGFTNRRIKLIKDFKAAPKNARAPIIEKLNILSEEYVPGRLKYDVRKDGSLKITNLQPEKTFKARAAGYEEITKTFPKNIQKLINTAKTAKGPGKLKALNALVTMLGAGVAYDLGFNPTEVKAAEAQATETGVVDKAASWPIEHPWLTGGAVTGASKFTKADPLKYFRKVPRKILSGLGTLTGALTAWPLAAMVTEKITGEETPTFNIKNPWDRAGASAELGLAPTLVKWTDKLTKPIKNQAVRSGVAQLLNLGMKPGMAMRVAKTASPWGWTALGAEGLYNVAKHSKPNYYIDPQTQEPTFYDRENASDVLPTMMDIYDQAYNLAKKENISYQEALNKVNPERFYKLKND